MTSLTGKGRQGNEEISFFLSSYTDKKAIFPSEIREDLNCKNLWFIKKGNVTYEAGFPQGQR